MKKVITIAVVGFIVSVFSFCTKEPTNKVKQTIASQTGNQVKSRGVDCCGYFTIDFITTPPSDFKIWYYTNSGWQTSGCLPANTSNFSSPYVCHDEQAVIPLIIVPCSVSGGTYPAKFCVSDFIAELSYVGVGGHCAPETFIIPFGDAFLFPNSPPGEMNPFCGFNAEFTLCCH